MLVISFRIKLLSLLNFQKSHSGTQILGLNRWVLRHRLLLKCRIELFHKLDAIFIHFLKSFFLNINNKKNNGVGSLTHIKLRH